MRPEALASVIAAIAVLGVSSAVAQPYGVAPREDVASGGGFDGIFMPERGRSYQTTLPPRPLHATPRYEPGPISYDPERPARSGWRRGQILPPTYRNDVVEDYSRFHLRRPPKGYSWYRDADDFILASVATGLIFEVISAD
jgi:Ni/Co efflux regulator RcnB